MMLPLRCIAIINEEDLIHKLQRTVGHEGRNGCTPHVAARWQRVQSDEKEQDEG